MMSVSIAGINRKYHLLFLLGLALSALAACSGKGQGGGYQAGPPEVTVSTPIQDQVTDWDEYTGRFAAVKSVDVRSRVSGYLEQVNFTEGTIIKKDALLFVVDPRPFQAALDEKKADMEQAQAMLELAQNELNRAKRLHKTRAISDEQLDARLQAKDEALAGLDAARAQVKSAQLNLEFTHIKAAISGRISRALVTEGNLVTGGSQDSTLLTTIVSLDPIYFYFTSDEPAFIRYIRLDRSGNRESSYTTRNPVKLKIGDEEDFVHQGYMDFVDNQIDGSTGTMLVRAVFENPDHIFVPGLFGKIRLLGEGPYPALLIPDEAIATDQSRKIVYTVDDLNMIHTSIVSPGQKYKGLRAIRAGLKPTDRVVINGIQRVREGIEVHPIQGEINAVQSATSNGGQ